jgi:hypothetical protein
VRCGLRDEEREASTAAHVALHVTAVRRLAGAAHVARLGWPGYDSSVYKVLDPLELTFDARTAPKMVAVTTPAARPGLAGDPPDRSRRGDLAGAELFTTGCRTLAARFAGSWDLERTLSVDAPATVEQTVHAGMTHEQVAYVLGFPPASFASKAELLRAAEWRFAGPPLTTVVTFDGDRVTAYRADRIMPPP